VVLEDPAMLEAPPDDAPSAAPLASVLERFQRLELPLLQRSVGAIAMGTRGVGGYRGQFKALAEEIRTWRGEGFTVRLVVDDERQSARLRQMLAEHDLEPWPEGTLWSQEGLAVIVGECAAGFQIPAAGLIVLCEEEIFGAQRRRLRRPLFQRGAAIASFNDLAANDLVVHEQHGIGRYHGLRTLSSEGHDADFLLLEYADGGRLYLPVERLDLISKYMGAPEGSARLDRLGGGAWQRLKESVRAALRDMAEALLKLYATRSVAERPHFSDDTPWQGEFEAAFRFEETPDQLRAIEEVKTDMVGGRPMDRLVAGDVGYGKTEVALRAAFKAVADGRQVAVLVPTTVLAQQHFNTFVERFGPFPARVELLSRFRSPKEQKQVVAGLAAGAVDVVVGTHRLLSKDVSFKNLGLLVVDEEHRFGVSHKERLKQLRTSVDVLTLTATPIPRTLHMALSGVRDLSVIETPPLDRLPVETVVTAFSRGVIKEAGRPGLLRPQPYPVARLHDHLHQEPRPGSPGGDGARPDGGAGAGERDGQVRGRPGRRPGLHRHRGIGPGHPGLEHDNHQPGRPFRAGPALPAPGPGRAGAAAGLRLPHGARRRAGGRDRPAAAAGDRGVHRAGGGAPAGHAGSGDPGHRQPAGGGPARAHRGGRIRSL
jgi:transcription-repair coupling factor (superfamily II helicase)